MARARARVAPVIGGILLVAHIATGVMPSWMPLAWELPNAAWAVLYVGSAALFAWLLWLGMKNQGSADSDARRVRISVSLSRRAWRESGTAAARHNANTGELGGPH